MTEPNLIDRIVRGDADDVLGELIEAIAEHRARPEPKPRLAEHLGLTDEEYEAWGGPSSRVVNGRERTTVGDAKALQEVIQARIKSR